MGVKSATAVAELLDYAPMFSSLLPSYRKRFWDDPYHYLFGTLAVLMLLLLGGVLVSIGTVASIAGGIAMLLAFPFGAWLWVKYLRLPVRPTQD